MESAALEGHSIEVFSATEKRLYLEMTESSLKGNDIHAAEDFGSKCLSLSLSSTLFDIQKDIDFQVLVSLSTGYSLEGQHDKALILINRALDLNPRHAVSCFDNLHAFFVILFY
jgi:hypothetical protein